MEMYYFILQKYADEMKQHMFADKLSDLELDDKPKIGYTFKCMGAGFWALRQIDFRYRIA